MAIFQRMVILALSVLCLSLTSLAATFTVNTASDTVDINPGNGVCADTGSNCSLRAAISEANALAGADTINIPAGTFTHSLVAANDNSNAGGDWDVTSQITINGAGAGTTILQASAIPGAATERVLEVVTGTVTITNMTVRHGRLNSPGLVAGGGIANSGQLSLTNVIVRDNQANSLEGGAIGGGIYNGGTALTLTGTTVTANSVSASLPGAGFGGGVGSSTTLPATIAITDSSISGNSLNSLHLAASGGGLYIGGIYDVTATGSHFDNNSALSSQESEGGGVRLVSFINPSFFNFTDCTFNGNTAASTTTGAVGGGLHLYTSSSTLQGTLDRVSINGNRTQGSSESRGGGLYVNPVGATINLDVKSSSISQNTNDGDRGGGVEVSNRNSTTPTFSSAHFLNTTISGNSAGTGNGGTNGVGGGIHIENSADSVNVFLTFVTMTDNFATGSGGGVAIVPGHASVDLGHSIIAGNGAGSGGPDLSGFFNSQNYNHIGNLSGATFTPLPGDTSGFDPQLGLLQNNGGPTLTHLLAPTSPLLDTIPQGPNGCGVQVTSDQRGAARPFGGGCDKGATEFTGPWSLSGVVKTTTGMPVRNAAVTISGGSLAAPVTVFTGNLGTYQFTGLGGSEYEVSVSIKRYHFNTASQNFSLTGNITDADFIANAPFSREMVLSVPGTK